MLVEEGQEQRSKESSLSRRTGQAVIVAIISWEVPADNRRTKAQNFLEQCPTGSDGRRYLTNVCKGLSGALDHPTIHQEEVYSRLRGACN